MNNTCKHVGDVVREQECKTCAGNVRIKVHACPFFTECTMSRKLPDVQQCGPGCRCYEPIDVEPTDVEKISAAMEQLRVSVRQAGVPHARQKQAAPLMAALDQICEAIAQMVAAE